MLKYLKNSKYLPFIIAAISFGVFAFFIIQYNSFYHDKKEKDIRTSLLETLIFKKSQIEKSLYSRIYYTKGVAAYISINPDISDKTFKELAEELINKDSVISTMAISRNCIINAIYPLEGHESAIGLDLLAHPFRKKIVDSTIRTRNTFVAGPVELVEGGIAFISYTPVFLKEKNDSSKFWGVADIVILKDKLFNEIKFTPQDDIFKYSLRGADGNGLDGDIFFGDKTIFNNDPVLVDIVLPTGKWVLASMPIKGWKEYLNKTERTTIVLYLSAVIISILIWLLAKAFIKIRTHEKELKVLFGAIPDLIMILNKKGEFVKIAPTNEDLLLRPSKDLLGKSLHHIFPKEQADYFLSIVTECIATKKMITLEYPLLINNQEYWFLGRISYLDGETVFYTAQDNTEKKKNEELIKESELKLKELNSTKDKLFSIIAHDLRSPFTPLLNYSQIIAEDIETLSKEEIVEFSEGINDAAKSVFRLLENLLEWAKMQSDTLSFNPSRINLKEEVDEAIDHLHKNAINKNIFVENKIEESIFVNADVQMLRSILHNILSNSIKFTRNDGNVVFNCIKEDEFIEVSIVDNGVGISENRIGKLFKIEKNSTTAGTNFEKGSGLGLLLCKDFVEKHGGEIRVESVVGKGTAFYFTLPI